jgi:hypothetical protein
MDLPRHVARKRVERCERGRERHRRDVMTSCAFGKRDDAPQRGRIRKSGKSANDGKKIDRRTRGAFSPFEAVHPRL